MYEVYVNNRKVKEYPFKLQAITYCFMNGYIACGSGDFGIHKRYYFMNPKVKIRKVLNV